MSEFSLKLKGKILVCIDWANVYGWFKGLGWKIDPEKLFKYLKSYPEVVDIKFYYGTDDNAKSKKFLEEIKGIGFNLRTKDVKLVPVNLDKTYLKTLFGEVKALLDNAKQANSQMSNKLYDLMRKIEDLPLPEIDYPEYHTVEVAGEKQLFEIFDLIEELDNDLKKANIDIIKLQEKIGKPLFRRKGDFDCELSIDILENVNSIDSLILFSGDGDYAAIVNRLIEKNKQVIVVFASGHKGKEYNDFKKGLFLCSVARLKSYLK